MHGGVGHLAHFLWTVRYRYRTYLTYNSIDGLALNSVPALRTVLWIRFGFSADLDPAFYPNGDPNLGSQTNADP